MTGSMSVIVHGELERMARSGDRNPDDYEVDGILHCGTCGEAKQAWIDWPSDEDGSVAQRLVPLACKCKRDEFEREKAQKRRDDFKAALRHLRVTIEGNKQDGDMDYSAWTFDADDSPQSSISRACRDYVEAWPEMKQDNMGILFFGSKGTGKSFYAGCIVNALAENEISTAFVPTVDLMRILSAQFDKTETFDALRSVQLLALDDLGAERDSAYAAELLYSVIDARNRAKRPTIITTNFDTEDMKREPDLWRSRIYDRVTEMCPIQIKMVGESRRKGISDARREKARQIMLGLRGINT